MTQKRKLQVFISSTFADLTAERQAAVEAILTAGNIPAGMELFAAGDESQMNVIKRWIDESDVFLLILGARYGSIEPNSGKSYIHLEYEYAVASSKPLFTVVIEEACIEDRVRLHGTKVFETDNPQKLRAFKQLVLSKMVRFWRDPRDIKLAVMETLAEFSNRPELVGWVSGAEAVNTGALANEFARLTKENAELRERLSDSSAVTYNGLSYEQMHTLLNNGSFDIAMFSKSQTRKINSIAKAFDSTPNLLHLLWLISGVFRSPVFISKEHPRKKIVQKYQDLSLIERVREVIGTQSYNDFYQLTSAARDFLVRFRLEHQTILKEEWVFENFDMTV